MTPLVLRAVSYNGRRLQCFVVRRERYNEEKRVRREQEERGEEGAARAEYNWGRGGCLAVEERRVFYFGGCVEVRRASCCGAEESALWAPAGVEQGLSRGKAC